MIDIFAELENIKEDDLHPKFKILKEHLQLNGERDIINDWVLNFEDRDNKIVMEFQTTFHSALWEFFLYKLLVSSGHRMDFTHNRPDFMIIHPDEINIEAVVSEIKDNGTKEDQRSLDDILSMIDPPVQSKDFEGFLNEAITRHSNAINGKVRKFNNNYSKCNWVKKNTPFVIALSSYSQINYGREFYYPMIALLYGLYYCPQTQQYSYKNEIIKPGRNSPIPLSLFLSKKLEEVSAIIFSCTISLGKLTALAKSKGIASPDLNYILNIRHDFEPPEFKIKEIDENNPEELSDGVFVFHNPFAKNNLPDDFLKNTNVCHVTLDNGRPRFEANDLPMVSRLNVPKIFIPDIIKSKIIVNIFLRFNPDCILSEYRIVSFPNANEIVLEDLNRNALVVIDLTPNNAERLRELNVDIDSIITALIKTNRDENGNSYEWRILDFKN